MQSATSTICLIKCLPKCEHWFLICCTGSYLNRHHMASVLCRTSNETCNVLLYTYRTQVLMIYCLTNSIIVLHHGNLKDDSNWCSMSHHIPVEKETLSVAANQTGICKCVIDTLWFSPEVIIRNGRFKKLWKIFTFFQGFFYRRYSLKPSISLDFAHT